MKIAIKERPYLIPSFYQVLRDEPQQNPEDMEKYFNDVYKMYLRHLSNFEMIAEVDSKTENELASMLSELIRVKRVLQAA